jgi:phage-related protein (TIGR01555 family)
MSSIVEKVQKALKLDGWNNVLTSIGIKGKDKRMSATVQWERGNRDDFDHFYSADDVAGNIVDIVPEDSFTKGYKLKGVDDPKTLEAIMDRGKQLKIDERYLEAWKIARIHGGAGVIKVTEDAKMDLPMPTGKKLLALNVVDRWDLQINSTDIDGDITSPTFREAIRMNLQVSEGSQSVFIPIHGTRVVKFDGAFLPRRMIKQNQYWGDSILTKLYNPIRNYQISNDAAALTVQDFDIPVLKLKNLAQLMTADCDDQVIKRLEMVNLSKSIAKMIVLDADMEEFDHKSRNVTGLADILNKVESRLVSASKMPRTKLLGESAGGLGSTGESQQTDWYSFIESQQQNFLKPKLLEVYRHIIRTEFPKVNADSIDIEFNPLWQMSEIELSTMRKTVAETDQIYITNQVVDPTEVAISRFGGDKYSTDTIIDESLRKQGSLIGEEPIEPLEEKPVEQKPPPEEKMDKLTEFKDEITKAIKEAKKDLKPVMDEYEYILKAGETFDKELEIKDAQGFPLKLDGYEFKGFFKMSENDANNIAGFEVNKTNIEGKIRLTIKPEILDSMLKIRLDDDKTGDMGCFMGVHMKKPNGKIKRLKLSKVLINV